jgi:secondary thiamine-phosphate synthase enzyme
MIRTYSLKTQAQGMYLITAKVQEAVEASGVTDGICVVWCPHTTAAITINENADPDVTEDLLFGLGKAFPDRPEFRHFEGNSSAHLKASCVGCNQTINHRKRAVASGNMARNLVLRVRWSAFPSVRSAGGRFLIIFSILTK